MMADVPGIGLVGAGAFGAFCLNAFHALDDVRIVAIADIDRARAQTLARQFGAAAYESLDALLADPAVTIVALNTPPYLHHDQGLAALHAGKHLFCEKPLALTIAQGQELIDAASAADRLLTVDYVMRHNPFWAAARRLAQSGALGELRHLDLMNHAAGLDLPDAHWFWDEAKSGGIWIEHGVHFFDAFAWVADAPGEILASTAFRRRDGATERVECLARFGGAAAHCYHAFDQSGSTEQTTVTLTFARGYVTLREWVPTSIDILTEAAPESIIPHLAGNLSDIETHGKQRRIHAYEPAGKAAIYRESIQAGMRDLAQAITRRSKRLSVSGDDGLRSLALAVRATEMARG